MARQPRELIVSVFTVSMSFLAPGTGVHGILLLFSG